MQVGTSELIECDKEGDTMGDCVCDRECMCERDRERECEDDREREFEGDRECKCDSDCECEGNSSGWASKRQDASHYPEVSRVELVYCSAAQHCTIQYSAFQCSYSIQSGNL